MVEYDFELGGAEWVVLNLCNEMAAAAIGVTLLTNRRTSLTEKLDSRIRLDVKADRSRGLILLWCRLVHLAQHLSRCRYAVLFSTERTTSLLLCLAKMLVRNNALLVIREAATNYSQSFEKTPPCKRLLLKSLFNFAYRNADLLIANSPGTRRSLERNKLVGRRSRLVTIHNPVDIKWIQQRALDTSSPKLYEDRWTGARIIAIGRLVPQKRMQDIIKAIGMLRRAGVAASLLVLGEGGERTALEKLIASEGLGDVVRLAGRVENPYPLLKKSDVLVLASESEGFGMVVVEALALGVPVVASDIDGGPREILGGGLYGKLFEVGHISCMAERIRHYIECRPDARLLIARAWEFDKRIGGRQYMVHMGLLPAEGAQL